MMVGIGECIQIQIVARNSLPWPLKDISLSVQFFQDYQNNTYNFNLDTRLAMAGPSHLHLPIVSDLFHIDLNMFLMAC